MTTAVSGLTREEAHSRHSWTISLATGGEKQLRHSGAPAFSRNVPRQAGVAAARHLPAAPSAAKRRSVHRKNGILQILLWEAELGSDHCQREERGRRLLKQQRPVCQSSRSSSRAAGDPGRGVGTPRLPPSMTAHLDIVNSAEMNIGVTCISFNSGFLSVYA